MTFFDRVLVWYNFVRPGLDVGLLTFILYKAYLVIVKTHGVQIIKSLLLIVITYALALFLNLSALLWILNVIAPGMIIGVAIVFQPELRKIFMRLGQAKLFRFSGRVKHSYIDSVLIAAEMLSNQRRGMLAVFIRNTDIKNIAETGTRINAELSSSLLVTIFGHDTPLHDGAVLIEEGKIIAAGCFLPLSEQYDIKKTFGTRHRAALGVSEETDAVVLVVSEETGAISLAYDSHLYYDLTMDQLNKTLDRQLDLSETLEAGEDDDFENETPV